MTPHRRETLFIAGGLFATRTALAGEITPLFGYADFGRRRVTRRGAVSNFDPSAFDDRAWSPVIRNGYWNVSTDACFRARGASFRPGEYRGLPPSFAATISSAPRSAGHHPGCRQRHPPMFGSSCRSEVSLAADQSP